MSSAVSPQAFLRVYFRLLGGRVHMAHHTTFCSFNAKKQRGSNAHTAAKERLDNKGDERSILYCLSLFISILVTWSVDGEDISFFMNPPGASNDTSCYQHLRL